MDKGSRDQLKKGNKAGKVAHKATLWEVQKRRMKVTHVDVVRVWVN